MNYLIQKFLLDIKGEEIILKLKNELIEFYLSIPLIENNNKWIIKKFKKFIYIFEIFFWNKFNNKGPKLIIIKSSKGKRFEGYNPLSWDTTDKWKSDPQTFFLDIQQKIYNYKRKCERIFSLYICVKC